MNQREQEEFDALKAKAAEVDVLKAKNEELANQNASLQNALEDTARPDLAQEGDFYSKEVDDQGTKLVNLVRGAEKIAVNPDSRVVKDHVKTLGFKFTSSAAATHYEAIWATES